MINEGSPEFKEKPIRFGEEIRQDTLVKGFCSGFLFGVAVGTSFGYLLCLVVRAFVP